MQNILTFLFIIVPLYLQAQDFKIIKGYIKDSTNNEALIGATVLNTETQKSTESNNFGYFQFTVPAKDFKLMFSYVGYKPKTISFSNTRDSIITIFLSTKNDLKEVAVYGTLNDKLNNVQTGVEVISAKDVKSLPVIMGESDIMRTIFLLPGVTFGTENSAGYFVRGGSNDQNSLFIDGAPVYNAYHLYGFFSVINTDAINKATLYKGDMPARFGEGLSSLLDIQLKEGNAQKFSAEATFGIVASKFMIEGPIKKGKTSFLITGRRSMMDIIPFGVSDALNRMDGLERTKRDVELTKYYFYDLSSKINHTFSDHSKLFLSFYKGIDDYVGPSNNAKYKNLINWGNISSSLRWNYLFSNSLFSNFTFYFSKFNYNTQNEDFKVVPAAGVQTLGYSRKYSSGIRDYSGKADFEYSISDHLLKFGAQYISREVKPGVNTFFRSYEFSQYNIDTTYNFNKKVNNGILYFEDYFKLFGKLSVNTGLRFTGFYTEKKLYPYIQPRLSLNFQPVPVLAFKASYSRVTQNLHLLSNNILGGPADIWVPATRRVAPACSDQVTLGITHSIKNLFTLNIEAYMKYMNNLIMYKEGASYLVEKNDWQDKIEIGKGTAKGIEFSLYKKNGNITGWVSYTLSRSDRKFTNINFGREFPYTFDRRHNISIAVIQKIGNKLSIGADWIFATGNAVTLANTFVYNELQRGEWLKYYNSVNNYRMPSYHRLDMCINYFANKKKLKYTVSAGAYNVYNRANPYILLDTNEGIRQQSLFPILPYISLSVKF